MRQTLPLLLLSGLLLGCPVTQPQQTPVDAKRFTEDDTGRGYWLYVPSYYDGSRQWPLVITLHGTHGWDSSWAQMKEWKHLAEQQGFIVAAPDLRSVQGIVPVVRQWWYDDVRSDEQVILQLLDELVEQYSINEDRVLLTGFSAGGYPLYYTGLRNPGRFDMVIARACNSDVGLLDQIELTEQARKLPVVIFWGKDDLKPLRDQSWQAFRYLREHGCVNTEREEIEGGHLRRPGFAWEIWQEHIRRRQ
ncbi:MAG: alpha/beta hydrolase-fold protein [Phycisphaerae bacterium]